MKIYSNQQIRAKSHIGLGCFLLSALAACDSGSQTTLLGENVNEFFESDTYEDSDSDNLFDDEELLIGTDPFNADTDDDGITDDLEDLDGDGMSNILELTNGTDPNVVDDLIIASAVDETTPLIPSDCFDTNSQNSDWTDNCLLEVDGIYSTSNYSTGVQTILWCLGFGHDMEQADFVSGVFDIDTADAVSLFQTANTLVVDGKVNPETWGALQQSLVMIESTTDYDGYAVDGVNCGLESSYFYQVVDDVEQAGWKIIDPTGDTEYLDFGI